jgi:hypothetical protein
LLRDQASWEEVTLAEQKEDAGSALVEPERPSIPLQ